MPVFRFHLRTPHGLEYDAQGLDLPSLDAAYLDACATVPALAAEFLKAGRDPLACTFLITDAQDRPLMEVPFRERLRGRPPAKRARGPNLEFERAKRLMEALRTEHARLGDNLDRLRALVTGLPPDGPAPRPVGAPEGTGSADGGCGR